MLHETLCLHQSAYRSGFELGLGVVICFIHDQDLVGLLAATVTVYSDPRVRVGVRVGVFIRASARVRGEGMSANTQSTELTSPQYH